ncbi:TUDOR-SN protein 2 [Actinidia rufa]|uniref:TUDOR-SN protein 2 n=1 Tax=Actinidia rufa TaxID=165716 RepID=A0A7J0DPJ2_9ERIC|nr:TUDOR-SN protein 2 [Actinidia rufa]
MHIADLTTASAKKTKDFLPFLQQKRLPAVVEYVLSGHRFYCFVPKEMCNIAFSFSGVRCPDRDEPLSDKTIALMRQKLMQRWKLLIELKLSWDSIWESKTNRTVTLLEAGLAKLQTSFGTDRIPDAHLLAQAEQSAKRQKLKIWENFVEGEEISTGPATDCWGVLLD